MTDLRRTAQLVKDLQILQVLEEDDDIEFYLGGNGGLFLAINFNFEKFSIITGKDCVETIKKAIQEEFSEKMFYVLSGLDHGIICELTSKE